MYGPDTVANCATVPPTVTEMYRLCVILVCVQHVRDYCLCVWETQVWFRSGIQHLRPEGCAWEEMAAPGEVAQVSCGPGDLLWAVLWDGQLLVRMGISSEQPKGSIGLHICT